MLKKSKKNNLDKVTIKEIAEIAGVSRTTVSRVLSGGTLVNKKTKDKILKIIKEKNYKPSIIAQSLRTRRTKTIGLVLADIENPFYSRVAKGVIDIAESKDYNVILCNSNNNKEMEGKEVETLLERGVDGLLLTTVELKVKTIENLRDMGCNFFLIDCKLDIPGLNYIANDDYFGAELATEYLIKLGHKRIFFLGNRKLLSLRDRYQGFKDTLERHRINNDKNFVPMKFISADNVYDIDGIIEYILNEEKKITAIFAGNDYLAIRTIDSLINSGMEVPEDISVIGYDNISFSSMNKVPLTTIRQPKYLLGKLAAEQLIEKIENKQDKETKRMILRPELVIRKSCGKVSKKKL